MTVTTSPLDFYAAHGCSLFPCAWGTKRPLIKWKDGSTTDRAAWSAWLADNSNLAVDCAKSGLIVVDIDSSKVPRDVAWAAYARLAATWGLATPPAPMTQSARGGWHVPFRRPAGIAPTDLRGGGTLVKISDIRPLAEGEDDGEVIGFKNRGYCVAAGSILSTGEGDLPYLFYPDAPAPHTAPEALIELLRLPIVEHSVPQGQSGTASPTDVSGLVAFLDSHSAFDTEPEWFAALGAIKLACGDTEEGLIVAREITRDDATEEALLSRWNRLASSHGEKPNVRMVTVGTWIKRAKSLGWSGRVGKSAAQMFAGVVSTNTAVANLAASVGAVAPVSQAASLAGNTQRIIANQGEPYLSRFFQTIHDVPISPRDPNHPNLPGNLEELYPSIFEAMCGAITRIVVMAETPRTFKQQRVMRVLGVLAHMHAPTCQALVDYVHGLGAALSKDNLTSAAKDFEKEISAAINSGRTAFYTDNKGKPDPAISDNVGIFLNLSNHRTQWDTFGRKAEVASGDDAFVHFDQDELDRLWMMAKSVDYNYHPAEGVFRTGIKVEARKNQYDSLEDEVLRLSDLWDGVPRLDTWLMHTCNVADDPHGYHRTVGRNLIGGMVKRSRAGENGVKHDEVVIFISPKQGTGKSTIANILARKDDWFLGKFKFGQSDQSSLPLLAGKWVVELGELAGLSKTDFEDVKSFLSEKIDTYVAKYEVLPTKNPRRCIFVGTSNLRQPLGDPSGNRRFLPVHVVGKSNLDWLRRNIDQLIGEAAKRHAAGETFDIPEELWEVTAKMQESARAITAVEEAIHDWFDRDGAFTVMAGDIGRALKMIGLPAQSRYSTYMEKLGWEEARLATRDRTRVWRKRSGDAEPLALEPAQMQVNGRVEMRVRQVVSTTNVPPPIPGRS